MRSGLRAIVSRFKADVRLTTQQDVLVVRHRNDRSRRGRLDAQRVRHPAARHALAWPSSWSMSCPAIPTCGLAITESERALPGVIDQLETVLADLGLAGEPISVRMTGCPNGCARPYQSEVGIVGRGGTSTRSTSAATASAGGSTRRCRTPCPSSSSVPKLSRVFAAFKAERSDGELFGDFCTRIGVDRLKSLVQS